LSAITCVLDGAGDATVHLAVGWHHIADITGDEQVAGRTLGDQLGNDARVGAGDEHRTRLLGPGQAGEQRLLFGIDLGAKAAKAIDQMGEGFVGAFATCGWFVALGASGEDFTHGWSPDAGQGMPALIQAGCAAGDWMVTFAPRLVSET